ncbi:hypothetical protein [Geminicoccus harenae]|uniref:hypothetical protein n=1 Tax=Geminicoccus harenae TaxID=2498453 RepID=UPI00168B644B|nr:hypothetical protein [Geminicoccus harenae]
MSKFRHVVFAAAAAALLVAPEAIAETNPTAVNDASIGSEGTADLEVQVPEVVRISKLTDISITDLAIANFSGTDKTGTAQSICVYSNIGADGAYAVTASGLELTNTAGAQGSDNTLPYAVSFTGGGTATPLTEGDKIGGFAAGASNDTIDCNGGTNASFSVTISSTDIQKVIAGTYNGTLTLLVQKEDGGGV